jgi:DNA-binding MarR family transcriptional regulator
MARTFQPHSPDMADIVLQQCACATLRETSRTITRRYDEVLKPSGLLATQYIVLVAIQKEQPAAISQLAEVMAMDRTTLTRNLKPLEKSGLVVTGRGDDQRTHVVSLTLKGKSALEKAFPLWRKAQTDVATILGATRFKRLLSDLKEVVTLFRQP